MSETTYERVTLTMDPVLLKEAKHYAVDHDTSLSAMIGEALKDWMAKKRK